MRTIIGKGFDEGGGEGENERSEGSLLVVW